MDQNKKTNGALIGSIIVILILIIGGVYVFKMNIDKAKQNARIDAEMQQANTLSSSDETTALEADLNSNANIDSIDRDYQ